jgi:zinc D-Ala-D-Ala carboxypeptidase
MQLSPHFSLEELTASETAARHGIDNEADSLILVNLERTAHFLERCRIILGHPIVVLSGFRCQALNRLVGGSDTSAHMRGLAADWICPGYGTPLQVCQALERAGLDYDQLIHEFGRWVHTGLSSKPPRHQVRTICSTVRGYQEGLLPCR